MHWVCRILSKLDYRVTKSGGLVLNHDNAKSRRFVEYCYRTTSSMLNPIVDWTEAEVWEFLRHYSCESNPLYQCGQKRIGCIGCPMQGFAGMRKELNTYPKYKQAYIKAFDRIIEANPDFHYEVWKNGKDVFKWWVGLDPNQMSFFPDEE